MIHLIILLTLSPRKKNQSLRGGTNICLRILFCGIEGSFSDSAAVVHGAFSSLIQSFV